ncbi:hypothetical protein NPIL_588251 [Nephila pilipes]|uniref:Uncharacterized protein n=1 Tax=Nephila pilipes TaxID=299642 RepID=A0A8X6QA99_NEPPI|nr:hypothetical protein NPIL_588251 [Nephila pilipes]
MPSVKLDLTDADEIPMGQNGEEKMLIRNSVCICDGLWCHRLSAISYYPINGFLSTQSPDIWMGSVSSTQKTLCSVVYVLSMTPDNEQADSFSWHIKCQATVNSCNKVIKKNCIISVTHFREHDSI